MVTFLRCLLSISSILQRKLLVLGSKISLLASNLGLNTSKYSNNCMKWLKVRPLFFSPIMIVTVTITNVLCVTISSRDGSSFRWHFQKHFPPTYVALLKTIKIFHSSRWLFEFWELFMSTNVESVLSISGVFYCHSYFKHLQIEMYAKSLNFWAQTAFFAAKRHFREKIRWYFCITPWNVEIGLLL